MSYTIELKDAFKGYTYDQDKIVSPKETIARFKKKTKRVNLDILSRTRRIDNGRLGIPVFFSECGLDARDVIGTKKQMGKGLHPHLDGLYPTLDGLYPTLDGLGCNYTYVLDVGLRSNLKQVR